MSFEPIERHPKIYLKNGDVVLAAQTFPCTDDVPAPHEDITPKFWLFRAHRKFMLSQSHSTAFTKLVVDAYASAGDVYDGVSFVRMEGDRA